MRRLHGRLRLKGVLVAEAPLHVGGEGVDPDADMPLARDGRGRLYVPGTSLTGALRAALPERAPAVEDRFWGATRRAGSAERTSLVWVADGLIETDHAPEIRDGVGIDRNWGTAQDEIKFERLVLPPGTRIGFEFVVDLPEAADEAAAISILADIVAAADQKTGWLALGAAQTRGLGRVSLDEWQVRRQRLDTRDGILALIRHGTRQGGDDVNSEVRRQIAASASRADRWHIRIAWTAASPVMVKAAGEGAHIKMLPLTTRDRDSDARRLALLGSGIKGALRTQVERIERTLRGNDAGSGALHLQMETAPLSADLFGAGGRRQKQDRPGAGGWRRGRGAVTAADCVAKLTIARDQIESLATQKSEEWLSSANADARDAPGGLDLAFHNAVDRWTGGAADQFLFLAVEPRLTWNDIVLTVDLARLPPGREAAALSLLLMVLRDLAEGWLTLGFGGNRGYGEIAVSGIFITGDNPSGDTAPRLRLTWDKSAGWSGAGTAFGAWLEEGWKTWREAPPEEPA